MGAGEQGRRAEEAKTAAVSSPAAPPAPAPHPRLASWSYGAGLHRPETRRDGDGVVVRRAVSIPDGMTGQNGGRAGGGAMRLRPSCRRVTEVARDGAALARKAAACRNNKLAAAL